VELWDLVSAFGRLLRETLALQPQDIIVDQTPMHVYVEQIAARLRFEPRLTLRALYTPPYSRSRLTGLFLAVLEMIRTQQIQAEQPDIFGDIQLSLVEAPPEPPAPDAPPPGDPAPPPA
jgi:segregation and condensation protein A